MRPGRNDPCTCGSGKKYKRCCQGKLETAVPCIPVKANAPTSAEQNQIIALFNSGLYVEMENQARILVEQYPGSGFAWKLLSESLLMQGKHALLALQKAAELLPRDVETLNNLGCTLQSLGQPNDAVASYRRALEIKPDFAEAHYNLGVTLENLRQLIDAMMSYRRALEIKPDYAEAYNNLGCVLKDLGELDGALACFHRVLEIEPGHAEAYNNLGCVLKDLDKLDDAAACFRLALGIKPDYAEAYDNLGSALQLLGQLDSAVASFRRALEIKPDFTETYSNLLFCLSHCEGMEAQTLFAEHCRFGEQAEAPFIANYPQHANARDPERPLRIGFVSGDLHKHSVAHFIEPVLAQLSSYPQLSLYAYVNSTIEDDFTQRIRNFFTHWHIIVDLSDAALAEKIRTDSVDILIDLSGHTGKNRLLTFARKPAPVQASWIGYPGTTGLQAMDYYLADRCFLPLEQFASQFTEKIVHLPASVPFMPSQEAPAVNALPALSNGYITFGSFNRLCKLSHSVIAAWSRLLRALPESRMALGGMPHEGCDMVIDWLAREGIMRERISFHPRCDMGAYLTLHHQVDICLDTFPYTGGTTTSHALWMGVPTLTIARNIPPGRQGAAFLGHVGLEAFVAQDIEDFIKKGLNWAQDVEALARIRSELRARFEQSALSQPTLIAEGLERALRIMWQRWCDGLPPVALDVSDIQLSRDMCEDGQ